MPTIISVDPRTRTMIISDPDADARAGRWCYARGHEPDETPDRCYTRFESGTLRHYPAEGYRTEVSMEKGETVYSRYGVCRRCLKRWRKEGADIRMVRKDNAKAS